MKKGFMLALLVVAMVALVLPVSGRAPIIKSLPVIIIGDLDPLNHDGDSNKGIMRFAGALDLQNTATVDWNNDESYTADSFHAYLYPADASPATAVKPYITGRIVDTLLPDEYADALSATDTPSTTTDIMSWAGDPALTNWLVNLFDAGRHPGITDPAAAAPATQGETPDAGYTKEVAMKLVCGVTSGTVLAASAADLTVRCQSNDNNEVVVKFAPVVDYDFTGSAEGWVWTTNALYPAPASTTAGSGSTGVGFIQASTLSASFTYAGWFSPTASVIPCSNAELNTVYRAEATLESTSTSPDTALGYRFRYWNKGFAHQGFVRSYSTGAPIATDAVNVPYAGNPMTVKAFWAARPDLGDMADHEGQHEGFTAAGDVRPYRVAIELFGCAGEQGTLTLEALSVTRFARPAAVTPEVTWGTGGIAFDSTAGGFTNTNAVESEWNVGTATLGTSNAVLSLGGTEKTKRYVGRKPNAATGFDAQIKPVSDHLYRFSVTVACGSPTAVPCYRIVVNSLMHLTATPTVNTSRNIMWVDWFAFSNTMLSGNKNTYKPTQQVNCPFAPATSGSVIDSYVYSHNVAATAAGTTIFLPILDVFDSGVFGTGTPWPDANTPMTYSAATWEDLGADY